VDEKLAGLTEKPLVFYELDATDPAKPWTAGKGTFLDLLITQAGGRNVGVVLDSAWAQISQEELLSQNPQVILLGTLLTVFRLKAWHPSRLGCAGCRKEWENLCLR